MLYHGMFSQILKKVIEKIVKVYFGTNFFENFLLCFSGVTGTIYFIFSFFKNSNLDYFAIQNVIIISHTFFNGAFNFNLNS